eukprot:gene7884-11655_t
MELASSVHSLASRQRRLRHVFSVSARNLSPLIVDGIPRPFSSYITLHTTKDAKPFYKSEIVSDTTNPTWQHLDPAKVWGGHPAVAVQHITSPSSSNSIVGGNNHGNDWPVSPPTAAAATNGEAGAAVPTGAHQDGGRSAAPEEEDDGFSLLVEWDVELYGLEFLAEKMEEAAVAHPKDSLVFGMRGGFYWAPDRPVAAGGDPPTPLPGYSFLKVSKAKVKKAYTKSSFQRITVLQRAIQKKQATLAETKAETCRVLEARLNAQRVTREAEQIRTRVRLLRGEEKEQGLKLKKAHGELRALRQSADKRAASLQSARRTSEHNTAHLVAMRSKYKESLDLLHQASAMVTIRQTRIILQLHTIYPVEQLSPSLFTICSMELPSAERSTASNADEEAVATALGYTAHFVVMIAKSSIRDDIDLTLPDKDREYPLYSKGKEKASFEQGVALLNKNIQQLVDACVKMGTVYDPNATLPNLRLLMKHYESLNQLSLSAR